MRKVTLKTDECGEFDYEFLEEEFAGPDVFDGFVVEVVDMIRELHQTGAAITKVVVTDEPLLEEHDV